MVTSLIRNAAEAIGDDGGEILILLAQMSIRGEPADIDYFGNAIPSGGYLCLKVTDNGCGMDEEVKRRIFEPFFTTRFFGRGLGMSVLLGGVKTHKGAVQVFSEPGVGTAIKIYLPVANNSAGSLQI